MAARTVNRFTEPRIWDPVAAQYSDALGRSSRLAAARLITLANELCPLNSPSSYAIDLGAGTGSLTHSLAATYPELPILATDISVSMLDQLMSLVDVNDAATSKITSQLADMASPIGGAVTEGAFSHVFSTLALQLLPDPLGEGTLGQWARLLQPDGVVAIAIPDFDEICGPIEIWKEAVKAVDPTYVVPWFLPPRHWTGCAQLDEGVKAAGFRDVRSEVMPMGFNVGKEGFMRFFWESGNPMPVELQAGFSGDLTLVKDKMRQILDVKYDGGTKIPFSAALVVGRKSKQD